MLFTFNDAGAGNQEQIPGANMDGFDLKGNGHWFAVRRLWRLAKLVDRLSSRHLDRSMKYFHFGVFLLRAPFASVLVRCGHEAPE